MKNAKELIEEEERDRKKAEKRRAKKKVWFSFLLIFLSMSGLKGNDQLVAYATRFLAVRLKKYVWSHHHALKAKV